MPVIRAQIGRERFDAERLEPEQFITIREGARIIACGRIKPYEQTYELASVWVAEDQRGRALGAKITRELVRRFPQDEVYITTDAAVGLPAYYERLGFLRTQILPDELVAKIKRVCETLNRDAVGMVYDRRIERLPTIAETYRAKHVLENYLPRTPLQHNLTLSRTLGCEAYLKLENLQPIGAFKVRGGVYLASTLSKEERERGIIGASTGNHGQSLAYGANLFGIRCVIAMPEEANPMKVESMRARELQMSEIETTAEGLATGRAYYTAVKTFIDRMDDMLLVSDEEMRRAVVLLLRAAHVVSEESGAAATAAAVKLRERLPGKKVAIVVSGGNMTMDSLRRV